MSLLIGNQYNNTFVVEIPRVNVLFRGMVLKEEGKFKDEAI